MYFKIALTLWILSRGSLASAQALVISGNVQDQAGAAMPDVEVKLVRGTESQTVTTIFDGSFTFDRLSPGAYDLSVAREGFKPSTLHVAAGSRSSRSVKIKLEIANLKQQITVEGD